MNLESMLIDPSFHNNAVFLPITRLYQNAADDDPYDHVQYVFNCQLYQYI